MPHILFKIFVAMYYNGLACACIFFLHCHSILCIQGTVRRSENNEGLAHTVYVQSCLTQERRNRPGFRAHSQDTLDNGSVSKTYALFFLPYSLFLGVSLCSLSWPWICSNLASASQVTDYNGVIKPALEQGFSTGERDKKSYFRQQQ